MGCVNMSNLKLGLKILILAAFGVIPAFMLPGCGYTTRSMISGEFRTIYITPFANKIDLTQETAVANKYQIYRPHLETELTQAVINKFVFDGNLKVREKDSADLILKGDLVELRKDPLRYTESNEVQEYRINIVVNISLWNRSSDKLVWQEQGFTGDTTYFTSGSQAISEEAAVTAGVKDLARRIVERTVEQW